MALTFPREVAVEAYLGEWTDVTEELSQTDPLVVTRGGADEQTSATPGTFSCTMRNETGNWTADNPNGAYYGLLGRNTPIRYLLPHLEHGFDGTLSNTWGSLWTLDGTAANFDVAAGIGTILVPDSASTRVAYLADYTDWSTYEVTYDVLLPFPTSGGALGCTSGTLLRGATASTGWRVALSATETGDIYIGIVGDGSFVSGHPLGVVSLASPTWMTVRTVVEGNLILAKAWERDDVEPLDWRVSWLADTMPAAGWVGVRAATSAGSTNTLISYDNFTVRIPRFHGEITSVTPGWNESHRAKWAAVKASGIFLRLQQGKTPLRSAPRRYIAGVSPAPVGYWPLEGQPLSESIPAEVGAGTASFHPLFLSLSGLAANQLFGKGDLAPWLPPSAGLRKTVALLCEVDNPNTSSTQWSMDVLIAFDGVYETDQLDLIVVNSGDDDVFFSIECHSNTGNVILRGPTGVTFSDPSVAEPALFDGNLHHVRLRAYQNGANVTTEYSVDGTLRTTGTTSGGYTLFVPLRAFVATVSTEDTLRSAGYLAIYDGAAPDIDEASSAMLGYVGETAGRRAERLCAENEIPFGARGDLDTTARMGPQSNAALMDLLQECADADQGVLLEMRGGAGVKFVCLNALYNQDAAVTLDYEAKQIQPGLRVFPDDKNTRNDITVQRLNGGEYRAQQLTGPLNVNNPGTDADAVGRYDESITVNVETDEQLADIAHWRLHLGADQRVVNLARHEAGHAVAAVLLGAEVGSVEVTADGGATWTRALQGHLAAETDAVVCMAGWAATPFTVDYQHDIRQAVALVGEDGAREAASRAHDLILGNPEAVRAVATALAARGHLEGSEVVEIVTKHTAPRARES
jgi:hypothetical protein